MNDSDNNTDNESSLSKAKYTKPSSNDGTRDSYKPFVSHVNSPDNDGALAINSILSLDAFKKSSSYEPLNEEELLLFNSYQQEEQEVDALTPEVSGPDTSFYDHDKMTTGITHTKADDNDITKLPINDRARQSNNNLLTLESKTNSNNKNTETLFGKQIGSGKLLMVGVVSGLILSAVIMIFLNTIGVLAIAEDRLVSDNANNSNAMPVIAPAANVKQSASIDVEQDKVAGSTSEAQAISEPVTNQNLSTNATSVGVDNSTGSNTTEKTNLTQKLIPAGQIKEEPSITYEDFREEAQNTLYREDKN